MRTLAILSTLVAFWASCVACVMTLQATHWKDQAAKYAYALSDAPVPK